MPNTIAHPTFQALFSSNGLLNVQECLPDRFASLSDNLHDTGDGRTPAPFDIENIPLLTGFCTSQVVQDFFHQQYV